jgi:hypothetical protein
MLAAAIGDERAARDPAGACIVVVRTIPPPAPRDMIAGMGQAPGSGPGSRAGNPQDVEVTGDLPMSLTTFVGRERELDELRSLFRAGKRLVTLVGIGGIGKTRLALELGFSAGDLGWAKVYLVELASLANPGLVDGAVLESVGGGSSRSPLQAAVEYLREATALLILDCCEHVLDAARRVAEALLRSCPSVAILATSRSPLDLAGELVWPVPRSRCTSAAKQGPPMQPGCLLIEPVTCNHRSS